MNVLRTELEKYINQLEIEMGKTAAAESELLRTGDRGADVLKSRVLTLREIIKDLNNILSNNTH